MTHSCLTPVPGKRRHRNPGASLRSRAGFTLLEMLITAILLATLLAGVWGLYGMFSSLYETGFVQTQKAQLVRSLVQQLSEDLANTVLRAPEVRQEPGRRSSRSRRTDSTGMPASDSWVSSEPGAADSASWEKRIGLLGTFNSLRLDVLQSEPPEQEVQESDDPYALVDSLSEATSRRPGEVITVSYTFQPPVADEDFLPVEPGLKRREIRIDDVAVAGAEDAATGVDPEEAFWSETRRTSVSPGSTISADPLSPAMPDREADLAESSMHLPEIVSLEFRYFDGQTWADTWDSRVRRSLPLAVEVAFQIEFEQDVRRRQRAESRLVREGTATATADAALVDPIEADLFSETGLPAAEQLPVYRFVIYLPQATRRQNSFLAPRVLEGDDPGPLSMPEFFSDDGP